VEQEETSTDDEEQWSREELLRRMDDGRARLDGLVSGRDDAALLAPYFANGWSLRDLLVHLAAWEERIAGIFGSLRRGEEPVDPMEGGDVDAFNGRIEEEARSVPARAAVEREAAGWARVRELVVAASDAELFQPGRWAWTHGEMFAPWIVGNTFGHVDEHLEADLAA
jgi:hypothetical protein